MRTDIDTTTALHAILALLADRRPAGQVLAGAGLSEDQIAALTGQTARPRSVIDRARETLLARSA